MLKSSCIRMLDFLLIVTCGLANLVHADQITPRMSSSPGPFSNTSLIYNGTLAPYVRNVTADDAWVVPRSKFDFGARDMICECFDPAGKSFDRCDCHPIDTATLFLVRQANTDS